MSAMSVERGEIFKIGAKEFVVIGVDYFKETVTLTEIKTHADDRVTITLSAKALGVLLKENDHE